MPEKVFLCCKTSVWGVWIAYAQITLCALRLLFSMVESAYFIYHYPEHHIHNHTVTSQNRTVLFEQKYYEDSEANVTSDLSLESPEELDYGGLLLFLVSDILLLLGFIFSFTMGIVLLKGCKQRNVPYLKSWLVFAVVAIFCHIMYVGLVPVYGMDLELICEMFVFVTVYIFGIGIVASLANSTLATQNPGGEVLPKYEILSDDTV